MILRLDKNYKIFSRTFAHGKMKQIIFCILPHNEKKS